MNGQFAFDMNIRGLNFALVCAYCIHIVLLLSDTIIFVFVLFMIAGADPGF